MRVYLFVCAPVATGTCTRVHMYVDGGLRLTLDVFLNQSLSYFLRQGFSVNLEVTNSSRPASPQGSSYLSGLDYRCALLCGAFKSVLGSELRSSFL